MNEFLDSLPPVGKMFKLVVILLLGVIAIALVMAIVKMLMPLLLLVALIAGGLWLYRKLQENGASAA